MPAFIGVRYWKVGVDERWAVHAHCRSSVTDIQRHIVRLFGGTDLETSAYRKARERKAKQICELCPVRLSCLNHALAYRETGIWGGTDDNERREMLGIRKRGAIV